MSATQGAECYSAIVYNIEYKFHPYRSRHMKHLINIFRENREDIKKHIFEKISHIAIKEMKQEDIERFFPLFTSLKNIYLVDEKFNQITPLYSKNSQDTKRLNREVNSLKENIDFDENGEYISNSYISSKDGNPTVTVSKKVDNGTIITMNFNLSKLLEELHYLNQATLFSVMTKYIYGAIGYSLSLFAVTLVFYALFTFFYHLFYDDVNIFHSIFKSTIALTLGLAIFDLAKNLLEHEVIYKERFTESHGSKKLLEKFLISIIIALSIEALMTVFKIALADYKDIIYAVYLILAVSVMTISLSLFSKNTKESE
jgi:hypothetical protein